MNDIKCQNELLRSKRERERERERKGVKKRIKKKGEYVRRLFEYDMVIIASNQQ